MFNPKTPLQAGAIFAAGILFIAWTTLDIHRVSRQNEQPLTEEQLQVLRELRNESLQNELLGQLCRQEAIMVHAALYGFPAPCIRLRNDKNLRCIRVGAGSNGKLDPYRVLGIPRNSSRAQVREAYVKQIRQYHPDVSTEDHALEVAVQLNTAYQTLMEARRDLHEEDDEPLDVFDLPEAEPDRLFVNPFACSINPLEWRKLQEIALQGDDPVAALSKSGVFAPEGAVVYLTPGQLGSLEADLSEMEATLSFEMTAWSVIGKLNRARLVNNFVSVRK